MASERAKADEENLRQTAFEKGEWANQPPTDLDVDYDLLSGALLGTAARAHLGLTSGSPRDNAALRLTAASPRGG